MIQGRLDVRSTLEGIARPRLAGRLKEPSFWMIQGMVIGVTVVHAFIEEETESVSDVLLALGHIPVALYLLPIAYASLKYGLEGGVLTGLWSLVLTMPNIVLWHRGGFEWLGESAYTALVVGAGSVMALPVERERRQRLAAEAGSRRLALLNEIATLSQAEGLERSLEQALTRLVDVMGLETARLTIQDDEAGSLVVSSQPRPDNDVAETPAHEVPFVVTGSTGETAAGMFAINTRPGQALNAEDRELLTGVGGALATEIDNARLHRLETERWGRYAREVTKAQEEERKRIARELHDAIQQILVLLCRGLEDLAERAMVEPDAQLLSAELRDLADQGRGGLATLRRVVRDLRPPVIDDLGLVPALEWMTTDVAGRSTIAVAFDVVGVPRRLPAETEVALFRVAQEALRNVERHAEASKAAVEVRFSTDGVRLSVHDDGRGFALPARPDELAHGGVGILGMKERVELVGGSFSIDSKPGSGTRVTVDIHQEP